MYSTLKCQSGAQIGWFSQKLGGGGVKILWHCPFKTRRPFFMHGIALFTLTAFFLYGVSETLFSDDL